MTNKLFSTFLLFIIPTFVFSQLPKPLPKIYNYENLIGLNRDGNTITDVQTDHENNIWVVTFASVTRLNGTKLKKIEDPKNLGNSLLRFYETETRKKFVIDFQGKIYWIQNDTLQPYLYNDSLESLNKGVSFSDVYFDDKNCLHISYPNLGYFVIDKGKVIQPLEEKGYKTHGYACILREGQLPFMLKTVNKDSLDKPFNYYLFNEQLELIDQRIAGTLKNYHHNSITKKKNGNYIYSSGNKDLIEFNTSGFLKKIPYNHPITRLFSDKDDGLWISIANRGVHYYEDGIIPFNEPLILKDSLEFITTTQDFQGNIWCYSPNSGLSYISHPHFRYFDKKKLPFQVKNEADLSLVIGNVNYNAAENIIKHNGQTIKIPASQKHNIYYNQSLNQFWTTLPDRLLYYENKKWHTISTEKLDHTGKGKIHLTSRLIPENNSYIGYMYNKYFFYNDSCITYVSPGFPARLAQLKYEQGSAYAGTVKGKIYLQVGDDLTILEDKYPQLKQSIFRMEFVHNELWISTYNGVFVLNNKGLTPVLYKNYNLSKSFLIKGPNNTVWLLNKQGSFEFSTHGKAYDSSTVSVSVYREIPAGTIAPRRVNDQSIYLISKTQEVGKVDFEDLKKGVFSTPIPQFEYLKIDKKRQKIHSSTYQINYDQSFIQISYAAVNFKNSATKYRYRMLGLEDNWSYPDDNYTQFTTLPSGKYSFEIQSKKSEGIWSMSNFLHFEIIPPFWQTWWFILISTVFVLSILLLVIRTRELRQQKKVEQEQALTQQKHLAIQSELKALRAQMNPHFTFNMLNAIQATVNNSDPESATKYIANTASLIRKVLENSRYTYTSLEKELHILKLYIELEQFRFSNCFEYKIELDEYIDTSYLEIPSMVIQPYIENAIIHGIAPKRGKGFLLLSAVRVNNQLKIIVEDNGIGRKQAIANNKAKRFTHNSMAMGITKNRLGLYQQEMKGKTSVKVYDLLSEEGKNSGTRVELFFPY